MRQHLARAGYIARAVWRRWQVSPYQWQLQHLRCYLEERTSECANGTRYRHWLTVRLLILALDRDGWIERVMPHIGDLRLDRIHNDTLASYRRARRADGASAGMIYRELSCVRRVLNLAARVWRHDDGLSWLDSPPLIEMEQGPARKPYPLSWEEQDRLFRELPAHLQRIALYKVTTGCRKQEVIQLRWNWEVQVPELETSVFILPCNGEFTAKNSQERIVVLNSTARRVIDEQRGKHPEFDFTYIGAIRRRVF